MKSSDHVEQLGLTSQRLGPAITEPSWRDGIWVCLVFTVLALVVNFVFGMDLAPDTLNYHLYAGFSAVNDRFSVDYFAAGPQAYLNPYVYAPFYWLLQASLSALAISSILVVLQSTIFWLTYKIAVRVCPFEDQRRRLRFGICAAALTFLNPILLQQLGSSYADITTADVVLAAWLLLAATVSKPGVVRIAVAALLLGIATALKLTNAVHAIAGGALLVMAPVDLRGRLRLGLYYAMAGLVGFAIVAGPWAYRLDSMFGSPLFPLFNSYFRSPEFTTESVRVLRFIPSSVAEALWRPFAIVQPVSMIHEELRSPDFRYAALVVLALMLMAGALWGRAKPAMEPPAPATSTRIAKALGLGFVIDWVLWLATSGNGRYFLPMASVAAVLVVYLVSQVFARYAKARMYILAALFTLQVLQLLMGTAFRWTPSIPWHSRWVDVQIPEKLAKQPYLYLTIGVESASFLAPYLASGSGLVNVSGQYAFGSQGANGARTAAMIKRSAPNVRVLARQLGPNSWSPAEQADVDDVLSRFELHVDRKDCETIAVAGMAASTLEIYLSSGVAMSPGSGAGLYASCRVVPGATERSGQMALKSTIDMALNNVEDACHTLFQPRRPYTEMVAQTGTRRYANTDLVMWVREDTIKFFHPITADKVVVLGAASDWASRPKKLECGRHWGHYFAKLAEPAGAH